MHLTTTCYHVICEPDLGDSDKTSKLQFIMFTYFARVVKWQIVLIPDLQ